MNIQEEFYQIRRAGTPFVIVNTPDYRAVVNSFSKMMLKDQREENPSVAWDIANGHYPVNTAGTKASAQLGDGGDSVDAPALVLCRSIGWTDGGTKRRLPSNSILFLVVSDQAILDSPMVIQAIANVRDAFKQDRRTLVILGRNLKLPALIAEDIPQLNEDLASEALIKVTIDKVFKMVKLQPKAGEIDKASSFLRGMTEFAIENAAARSITKNGLNLDGLREIQRTGIESATNRALSFEQGTETFDDLGGLEQIKKFATRLFTGKAPPRLIVRIEEIEKAMAGSGSSFGDSSGVSQDQLGVLLNEMEENCYAGCIATGPPGTGKSAISKAIRNTFLVPCLNLDMGACKGRYVGDSEGMIRNALSVIKSFSGKGGAFFVATSNNLSIISPELRRRFKFGIYAFDIPTIAERDRIWAINLKKQGLPLDLTRPDDHGYTGSDIRNVCELAYRLSCSLEEASEYIVPVTRSDPEAIAKFRKSAEGKFLSASKPGLYRYEEEVAVSGARKISMEDN